MKRVYKPELPNDERVLEHIISDIYLHNLTSAQNAEAKLLADTADIMRNCLIEDRIINGFGT